MYPFLKKAHGLHTTSLSFYSNLVDHCLSLKSLDFAKFVHAQLIKIGFNSSTYLGNRCIDLYSKFGTVNDSLQAFDDIINKNFVSWNICLKVFVKSGDITSARGLFDKMPERDVVSWNSMISGYASNGFLGYALGLFLEMQRVSIRPSGFTFSILVSSVTSTHHGKQIHGSIIRNGVNLLNVVVDNSLIDMYGKLGILDYAFGVFLSMEEPDVISWNSLILGCCKSGYGQLALNQFCLMRYAGHSPDEFTISIVVTVCSNLQDLEKGKQIFALGVKVGILYNTIVSSAIIDLFSKCNRLEDSVQLFEEINIWDPVICNAMISSYARHGFEQDALRLFVLTVRGNLTPTEFTLSSVLSSASFLLPAEQGIQFHSLVLKLGLESDLVVASSLVEMYAKFGLIDSAMKIFAEIDVKDLIVWNTMILGLARIGRLAETLDLFKELLMEGLPPDRITLAGVLLACNYGVFVDVGMSIFSSMEKEYGIIPSNDHYCCIVDMLCRAGKLKEAMDIVKTMPHEPSALIWESILRACGLHGDLKLTERVAERMIKCEPRSSLPYLVLARAYEMRSRWETSSGENYRTRPPFLGDSATHFVARRFESIKAANQLDSKYEIDNDENEQAMDFPGGRVSFTSEMRFISESPEKRIPCYRILDENGNALMGSRFEQVSEEIAVKMYSAMVTIQIMDTIFYEAQRQGRISFYVTSNGEEAINIASAAALTQDDVVLPQYREPGVLLWRGFTLQEFANQCFGNKADYGKGRQMPIHYGSRKHNYFTVSSPIATQLPQAVGVAYSLKMDKQDACVVTYFGDGGSSEGDFHASLNFAAVMEAPVVFICRNNGWAISTPISEQFRSDGIVARGQAYGIRSIRVDGNDALAVYSAIRAARAMAISEQRPILVEALTYRVGHHSTSDDSTKYRPVDEIERWKTAQNPLARYRKWVEGNGWWSDKDESELRNNVRKQLLHAIQVAERTEKPPFADLFTDVYDNLPSNLCEQERSLREAIQRHPQDYPSDVPI
ncbi:hypothetical protein F0562_002774 [Nyssa sinensis]|uniref:3-methyl-2-oxobutanoate dehydrogenase (2-methylpropanoyl-transferring) n=1 Tax=Nyssa sinensis TaxID=561372 RepID=A0A5J5BXM2_9ASTE|nr:hypothetical protein F0562_002774 [Nyssa sinensis]